MNQISYSVIIVVLCSFVGSVGGFTLRDGRRWASSAAEIRPRTALARQRSHDKGDDSLHRDSHEQNQRESNANNNEAFTDTEPLELEIAIDAFLAGDFDRIADSAPVPHPDLTPAEVIDQSLRALRNLDNPYRSHGAAVFQNFLIPLRRGERWGDSLRSSATSADPWKEIQRGALTASMLARRIRASEFSALLDWETLDVSDGAFDPSRDLVGNPSVAYVNAALYFGRGLSPVLIQFTLHRVGGLWLIDSARKSQMNVFVTSKDPER